MTTGAPKNPGGHITTAGNKTASHVPSRQSSVTLADTGGTAQQTSDPQTGSNNAHPPTFPAPKSSTPKDDSSSSQPQ